MHKNGYLYICNSLKKGSISVLDHKRSRIPLHIYLQDTPTVVAVDNDFHIYVGTNKFTSTGNHVQSIRIDMFSEV